ncbi:PEGA domain-containing protein [Myxococcota bacterium]
MRQRGLGKGQLILVAIGTALVVTVVFLASKTSRSATLVVSVAEPGGSPVLAADVFVDGERRCDSAPCSVEGLTTGPHRVRVAAPGYAEAVEQSTATVPGTANELTLMLTRRHAGTQLPAQPRRPGNESEATADPAQPQATKNVPGPTNRADGALSPASQRPRPPASSSHRSDKPTRANKRTKTSSNAETGTLTVSSQPPGMVYVNGRAVGISPRQLNLRAGYHTVTVKNRQFGQKTVSVNLEAGRSASVMLNF